MAFTTATLEQWAEHLRREADGRFEERLRQEMVKASVTAEREGKLNASSRLRTRSGRLRNSIRGSVRNRGEAIEMVLSAGGAMGRRDVSYARAQEEGATIAPRRGRYLAIPLRAALTPAGVPRRAGPREYGDELYFFRARNGDAFLASKKSGLLMYMLHPGPVVLRPRRFLRDAVEEARKGLPPAIEKAVVLAVSVQGAP
jgi:hypothetical protein